MNRPKWKEEIERLQGDRCLLCGEVVEPNHRSWDHVTPQAYSGAFNSSHRVGLVFMAHASCNKRRGHGPLLDHQLKRTASVVLASENREVARANIARVLDEHRTYIFNLTRMIALLDNSMIEDAAE